MTLPDQDQNQGTQTAQISGTVQLKQDGNQPQQQKTEQQPSADEASEKNPGRKFIVLAVVLVLAVAAGIFYWHSTFYEDTDDAQVDGGSSPGQLAHRRTDHAR